MKPREYAYFPYNLIVAFVLVFNEVVTTGLESAWLTVSNVADHFSLFGLRNDLSRFRAKIWVFHLRCFIKLRICVGYIEVLLKLERIQQELKKRFGGEPTFFQWAAAAGIDQKTLREQINYGTLCKDKMIKSNIRLVISIAKNYHGAGMNLQDLVQEGCRGLVRGAEKFDASKGFKFSTYAHWWIKQAVRKSLSDQSRTIRLPFHMIEATYRVKEAKKQLYSENGRVPNDEKIAEATRLSMKRLTAVLLTPKAPRSLDQKIGMDQDLKPSVLLEFKEYDKSRCRFCKRKKRDGT